MKTPSEGFRGERPGLAAEQLPAAFARQATMARLKSGRLSTYKQRLDQGTIPKSSLGIIRSIFWMDIAGANGGPYLLQWYAGEMTYPRVDVVRGPILEATGEPIYWTGAGEPKVSNLALATTGPQPDPPNILAAYPYRWYLLGVPPSDTAPTLEVTASIDDPTAIPIDNPGAESGTLFWTVASGSLTAPSNGDIVGLNAKAGTRFFSFGSSASSVITQTIPASTYLEGQKLSLKWWQASGANLSQAAMRIEFLNNVGSVIGDPVESAMQAGALLDWTERTLTTTFPAEVQDLRISMLGTKIGGGTTDAYIDVITMNVAETTLSYSCDSLAPFQVSPNAGSGNSFRRMRINTGNGRPAGCIEYEGDSRTGWLYRNFGGLDSSKVVFSLDTSFNPNNTASVSLFSGASGSCYAVNLVQNGAIRVVQRTSWDNIAGTPVRDLYTGNVSARWLTITCEITLLDAIRASLKVRVVNADTSEVYVDGTEEVEIPLNGGNFGWSSASNFRGRVSWVDNIAFTATPPSPESEEQISGTAYVFTWVGGLNGGDESAPSPASSTIRRNDGSTVVVTTPTDRPPNRNVTLKRIYRLNGNPAIWQLVDEIPWDQAEYEDTKNNSELGYQLQTEADWLPPPTDLHSLIVAANGMAAGLSGKDVCFSPVGQPHTFPLNWRRPLEYPGVAQAVYDADIIVATQGMPYIAQGDDPSSMSLQKTDELQGCVSARSMVTIKGIGAIYASPDGLVAVSRAGVRLLSKEVITRKEWQALKPSSITGVVHDDMYFGFYDTGTTTGGFIFDPFTGDWFSLNFHATAAVYNPLTDVLSVAVAGNRHEWDQGANPEPYDYWSGEFMLPRRASFASGRLRVMTGDTRLRAYYDGNLIMDVTINSQREFRLPKVAAENSCSWRLTGTGDVAAPPVLAESAREL